MLSTSAFTKSLAAAPPAEKTVRAKLLRAIYVKGVAHDVGDVVTMGAGDAQALRNSEPPKVEII